MPGRQAAAAAEQTVRRRSAASLPLRDIAAVGLGGAVGSVARYLAGDALTGLTSTTVVSFPWPIFAVNVSGCFVLGFLMIYLLDVWNPSRTTRLLLTTGLLGGYTTFSTYTSAVQQLISHHLLALADAYAFTSLLAGLGAVWLGTTAGRRLAGPARERRSEGSDRP